MKQTQKCSVNCFKGREGKEIKSELPGETANPLSCMLSTMITNEQTHQGIDNLRSLRKCSCEYDEMQILLLSDPSFFLSKFKHKL